ncbi:DUF3784 domain-containing protein [Pseudalkalibacillus hwajinpoensis]|uniref:DUF3784 domain-containing protein n=1 Tax=Guptibacillus hwajinpoensis TaxID=208199 RepID=UPI00325AE863
MVIAYLTGVKEQTWLLAGFNEKAIKDKQKLGRAAGRMFFLPLGVVLIAHAFTSYPYEKIVLVSVMLILLTVVYVYINHKLLQKKQEKYSILLMIGGWYYERGRHQNAFI